MIKHTKGEYYSLRSSFKGGKMWTYQLYSTKQSAIRALKRLHETNSNSYHFEWEIRWFPYPFSDDDESVLVYREYPKEVQYEKK